jgi:hypothetical protein
VLLAAAAGTRQLHTIFDQVQRLNKHRRTHSDKWCILVTCSTHPDKPPNRNLMLLGIVAVAGDVFTLVAAAAIVLQLQT